MIHTGKTLTTIRQPFESILTMKTVNPESTRIGWIGTGVMGRSMCSHLLKAGYKASVYNRSPSKLSDLISLGATACPSPREVALQSDVVFSMVGYPSAKLPSQKIYNSKNLQFKNSLNDVREV